MSDIPAALRNIRDQLHTGRFGQREIWEQQLKEAADEIERLMGRIAELYRAQKSRFLSARDGAGDDKDREIERLRAALKPFAIMADQVDEWQRGTEAQTNFEFSADDLRRARAVLSGELEQNERGRKE